MKNIITVKNLNYVYPDGIKALTDINIQVKEGECLGLVGPNGAGKSTFLLQLNGLLRGEGEINVLGLNINKENLPAIRSKLGLVFQDPDNQLFMPTVFDDVAFGPLSGGAAPGEVGHSVRQALRAVAMQGTEERSAHHLSFGEQKRISLATVLAMELEILVLDEPTSNLDPKSRRQFINLIKDLSLTKIIASHDLEMILDLCERVVVIDDGKIIACGPAAEILANEELMQEHGLEVPLSLCQERVRL